MTMFPPSSPSAALHPLAAAADLPPLDHEQLELLNRLGQALSMATALRTSYAQVVRTLREIFGMDAASLWTIDVRHQLLVKEGFDAAEATPEAHFDEALTHWQQRRRSMLTLRPGETSAGELPRLATEWRVVSLPIMHRQELIAVLNLYARHDDARLLSQAASFGLLIGVASQLELFITNRSLEANTTFYKEVHHRVKNNLQSVASVLRMQLRRLDRVSAEQALEDSINRIQSIALVHETLSQGEIGRVDAGELIGRISRMLTADLPHPPQITLQLEGGPVLLLSREATALALVCTELLQNAMRHGAAPGESLSRIDVRLECAEQRVELRIADDGRGLPPQFDLSRSANLGLAIVVDLTSDVLKGEFRLMSSGGTIAIVSFPVDQGSQPLAPFALTP